MRCLFVLCYRHSIKVWHKGLLSKLKSYDIEGNLLALLRDFLSDRQQRVVINGKFSVWRNISAGVPQGSDLGPLLFLIYINNYLTLTNQTLSVCR